LEQVRFCNLDSTQGECPGEEEKASEEESKPKIRESSKVPLTHFLRAGRGERRAGYLAEGKASGKELPPLAPYTRKYAGRETHDQRGPHLVS